MVNSPQPIQDELPWPVSDLEQVSSCPFCASPARTVGYRDVQDWSFGTAAGKWTYWQCNQCHALYLDPRPNEMSVGRAYGQYYTHGSGQSGRGLQSLKLRLKNEFLFHAFGIDSTPRLRVPGWGRGILKMLQPWITVPFGWRQLADGPKGLLIDVGCGNGDTLRVAGQLGWQALGIELDPSAVGAARQRGLNVVQGGYEMLAQYQGAADCVVCSHVLEHVHHPLRLLKLLADALKPNGLLLISAPNASSYLRDYYGENWRGLEAPRHLAIPDAAWLVSALRSAGFDCQQIASYDGPMATESERIQRRGDVPIRADLKAGALTVRMATKPSLDKQDLVQVVCFKM